MVAEDTGFRVGTLSEAGKGRRRLRMEEAAERGSTGARETGNGGGGDGGGDCWYVVLVLYVVQEKRLASPLSLLAVDPGVPSIDFLTTLVFGGVECLFADLAFDSPCSYVPASGDGCLFVGVIGLG